MKRLTILFMLLLLSLSAFGQVSTWSQNRKKENFKDSVNFTKGFNQVIYYNVIHGIGSADSVNITTGTVQNYYYKIKTGGAMTWREADGMTCAADSVKILTPGDYCVHLWLNATTSNTNDKMKVKMYVNNSALATSLGYFKINSEGAGNGETNYYMWYRAFTANQYISFRIANLSGARASNITDIKIFVIQIPEL